MADHFVLFDCSRLCFASFCFWSRLKRFCASESSSCCRRRCWAPGSNSTATRAERAMRSLLRCRAAAARLASPAARAGGSGRRPRRRRAGPPRACGPSGPRANSPDDVRNKSCATRDPGDARAEPCSATPEPLPAAAHRAVRPRCRPHRRRSRSPRRRKRARCVARLRRARRAQRQPSLNVFVVPTPRRRSRRLLPRRARRHRHAREWRRGGGVLSGVRVRPQRRSTAPSHRVPRRRVVSLSSSSL